MEWLPPLLFTLAGAVIASVAIYGTFKLQERRRRELCGDERRLLLLEQISEDMGRVNHAFLKYAALVAETGLNRERTSQKQQQELQSLTAELVSTFEGASKAEATLLLLGEKTLEGQLKQYTTKIAQFRRYFPPGKSIDNAEQINRAKQEVSSSRNQFYDALGTRYDQYLSSSPPSNRNK